MLVIADAERASAIGGVMGGAESEVSDATQQIVFESAWFKPQSVRATSKRLGLRTEASYRFERGADLTAPAQAMERALELLEATGAGRRRGPIVDCYPRPTRAARADRSTRPPIRRLLGMDVPGRRNRTHPDAAWASACGRSAAGRRARPTRRCRWDRPATAGSVTVPAWRVDVQRPVDLIEEVGRHYGFEHLPTHLPRRRAGAARRPIRASRATRACGARCWRWASARPSRLRSSKPRRPRRSSATTAPVALANPLSEKFTTLRPSLLPGLVDAVSHNRRHGRRDVRLFEIGTRFSPQRRDARGARSPGPAWPRPITGAAARRDVDFFDVKGRRRAALRRHGRRAAVRAGVARLPRRRASGRGARRRRRVAGVIGQLDPALAEARDLPRGDAVLRRSNSISTR